ncbi:MAG: hypothetical protein ACP5M4_02460 [Acidobacteriaceae bacterium]
MKATLNRIRQTLAPQDCTPWPLIVLLTPIVLFVQGYHPYANDAGIYIAGIRKLIHPGLYRPDAPFITSHSHLSIFAPILATFVRLTHAPFAWTILTVYLLAVALFLYASWQLATRLLASPSARFGALFMAAALYGLPVAGTALYVMDPYLTARSFSTPVDLLAVAAALDRRYLRTAALIALSFLLHPLMAAYAFAFVTVMIAFQLGRPGIAIALCASGPIAAAIADFAVRHHPISPDYQQAILQPEHTYLFLARWHSYELAGAILPLILFALAARRIGWHTPLGKVTLAAIATGISSLLIAALFVPVRGPYLLVPLQVMRINHIIYAIGLVLFGGLIGHYSAQRHWLAPAFFLAAFTGMAIAASLNFPGCRQVEWPGLTPINPWSQAFLWIRHNTPPNAIFAFNPSLIHQPLEDEQGFRVFSERSQLPDDKDSGDVAVFPSLAPLWGSQRNAAAGINTESDAQRLARLKPYGVSWILLPPKAKTHFPCPYQNSVTKVCRLARQK